MPFIKSGRDKRAPHRIFITTLEASLLNEPLLSQSSSVKLPAGTYGDEAGFNFLPPNSSYIEHALSMNSVISNVHVVVSPSLTSSWPQPRTLLTSVGSSISRCLWSSSHPKMVHVCKSDRWPECHLRTNWVKVQIIAANSMMGNHPHALIHFRHNRLELLVQMEVNATSERTDEPPSCWV